MNHPPHQSPVPGRAWFQPGILFAVLAMVSLSFSDGTSKWVLLSVSPVMVLWFRYAVQAVGTALVLAPLRGRAMWRTHSLRWQLLRGLLMVSCSLLAFYCLQRMPVAEFTATVMLSPLVLTALARFVMKEQVSPLRWLMVVGGLIGAMLVIRPGGQVDSSVGWMALTVVLTYAATLGQYLLIVAFSKAPASVVSPFLYTGVGFSTLMGWWLFDHIPDALAFTGMGLVVLCGVVAGRIKGEAKA